MIRDDAIDQAAAIAMGLRDGEYPPPEQQWCHVWFLDALRERGFDVKYIGVRNGAKLLKRSRGYVQSVAAANDQVGA